MFVAPSWNSGLTTALGWTLDSSPFSPLSLQNTCSDEKSCRIQKLVCLWTFSGLINVLLPLSPVLVLWFLYNWAREGMPPVPNAAGQWSPSPKQPIVRTDKGYRYITSGRFHILYLPPPIYSVHPEIPRPSGKCEEAPVSPPLEFVGAWELPKQLLNRFQQLCKCGSHYLPPSCWGPFTVWLKPAGSL